MERYNSTSLALAEEQAEIREERRKLIAKLNGMMKAFRKKKNTGSDQNGES